ncbi:hypothetical protein [Mycolicibacterium insubricum]|uniref:hypothetical protein n=1 Tax=Mycolicibacterium insubricum TaxID=444597 RepID=UPI0021F35886|nr:hypothetical protein [Mycolicibacterium insubricum]
MLAPYKAWQEYSEDTEALIHLTHEGFRHVSLRPQTLHLLGYTDEEIQPDRWKAGKAEGEIRAGFPTLHAHALLGLWGAFERFVEDTFTALIVAQPELLEGERFARIKLSMRAALASGEERAQAVLYEITRNTSGPKKLGVNQFEDLLDHLSLSGEVPENVKDSVFAAQQVRHVWAHRGGVADAQFVGRYPTRAQVGEKLMIDISEFSRYMHGLHMYGLVIVNRYLKEIDEPPVLKECRGYEGTWESIGLSGK